MISEKKLLKRFEIFLCSLIWFDATLCERDICSKTQNSSVRLRAPLRSLSNWRYIKFTYSFIHSFNVNQVPFLLTIVMFLYSVCKVNSSEFLLQMMLALTA